MELTLDSIDDFNLKYRDCVVELTYKDNEEELFLIEYLDSSIYLHGYITSDSGQWIPANYELCDVELKFTMPELGLVNYSKRVVAVTRRPRKQYRRGFTFKNSVIATNVVEMSLSRSLFGKGEAAQNCDLVNTIFNPIYYNPKDALDLILNKKATTVAINNRYYLSSSSRLPYIYLGFSDGLVIGRVNERTGKCTVFKSASPLLEDLVNYVEIR